MVATHPKEFLELSQEIGNNPLLVQGPGGNSSYKSDGTLWIKASGTRLSEAQTRNIFVPVDLRLAVEEVHGDSDGSCRTALMDPTFRYRPSIETTLHAVLAQKYVFHYHCVNSICHSATLEGRSALPAKLHGLSWVQVAYRHPGVVLTRGVLESLKSRPNANVVILENHGVIVAGSDIGEIRDLVSDIEERLAMPKRDVRKPSEVPPEVEGWTALPHFSSLVFDPLTHDRIRKGSYYPDHVVFLGAGIQAGILDEIAADGSRERFPFPVVVVPNVGVYIRKNSTPTAHEMLRCIHDVLSRVPPDWTLVPIGEEAEGMLLNWDAEKHRQALAKGG